MTPNGHVLDLTNYHFCRELGDLTLFGAWVGTNFDESEPCLALIPTYRVGYERSKPAVIALSSAYLYDDPSYLLQAARTFNEGMRRDDTMSSVYRVADVIHSHLQDLIEMPPRPVRGEFVGGSAVITERESGRTRETEIIDHV